VGRMLGLPYPGGPAIERAAQSGNPLAYPFRRPLSDPANPADPDEQFNFSFSGLKTAVMRAVQLPPASGRRTRGEESMEPGRLKPEVNVSDAAASFQAAAIDMLVDKTVRAAQATRVTAILIAGGVSANSLLRQEMKRRASVPVYYPPLNLCTDNAAMTAAAGYFRFRAHGGDALNLDVSPMLPVVANEHQT
jgi:N6-L-threonylcarbamoyladenine synthase